MEELFDKVRVIAHAGATWLAATAVLITTITPQLPEDWQTFAVNAVVWITTAVTFIRRHSPVKPSARGVLPVVHKRGF